MACFEIISQFFVGCCESFIMKCFICSSAWLMGKGPAAKTKDQVRESANILLSLLGEQFGWTSRQKGRWIEILWNWWSFIWKTEVPSPIPQLNQCKGFRDNVKVRGTLNDIFSLVITTMVGHFNVSQILIDGGRSCNIIYSKLFETMDLKKEICGHMKGHACKRSMARPPTRGDTLS